MLRIINKQAQALTTQDDAGLKGTINTVVRPFGEAIKNNKRERARLKGRPGANGTCSRCKHPLWSGPDGRPFCPKCTGKRYPATAPAPVAAPTAPVPPPAVPGVPGTV